MATTQEKKVLKTKISESMNGITDSDNTTKCPQIVNVLHKVFQKQPHFSSSAAVSIATFRQQIDGFSDQDILEFCFYLAESPENYSQWSEHILKAVEVPPFMNREHVPHEKEEFENVLELRYETLSTFHLLFMRVKALDHHSQLRQCLVWLSKLIVVLLPQHMDMNLWTDSKTCKLAASFMETLVEYFNCKSVSEFLSCDIERIGHESYSENKSLFMCLIQRWKAILQKEKWKMYPTVSAAFVWCLLKVNFPHVSSILNLLLPPSLLFVDDFHIETKVTGIRCLRHIVKNTSSEELRWYGLADVVFEALKQQLYHPEVDVILECYPAMMDVLNVVERSPSGSTKYERHNEVFQIIIGGISHENKIILRRARTKYLAEFIKKMGIKVVNHMQKFILVVEEYFEIPDGPEEKARINVLCALEAILTVAWPRIPHHSNKLVQLIVRLMFDISSEAGSTPQHVVVDVIHRCSHCLQLLLAADRENVQALLSMLCEVPLTELCSDVLKDVLLH